MHPHESALVWFRHDLRLTDNPALAAALSGERAVVPVFIDEPADDDCGPGAASRAWLHRSLQALATDLAGRGSRLLLLRGRPEQVLPQLARDCNATAVLWNRRVEPSARATERALVSALETAGIQAQSFNGGLWHEAAALKTGGGGAYRVFTPFWKSLSTRLPEAHVTPPPSRLPAPARWPHGLTLADLDLLPDIRWDAGFDDHWQPGEAGALDALDRFIGDGLHGYRERRDRPADTGISRLSPHLHFGEIGPRQILTAMRRVQTAGETPESDCAAFLRELGWREFAHHLLFHYPHTVDAPMNPDYADFPWRCADDYAGDLTAWQRGRTGIPIVDAGMRELWTTGWMHNRVRMLVASLLTKNLRIPWQAGARWFWDTLVDADLANNTLGWQWVAGCGADAAPYFRIFNPVLQSRKFDPEGRYIRRWVPELQALDDADIHAPWMSETTALAAGVRLGVDYPRPIVDLMTSRDKALAAYQALRDR